MADGLTKTYSGSLTTTEERTTTVHNMSYSLTDINSAFSSIPKFSKITKADLSYTVKKTTNVSSSSNGTYGLDFCSKTGTWNDDSLSNSVKEIVASTTIKNNTSASGSVSVINYVNSQNDKAGVIEYSGATGIRVWHNYYYTWLTYVDSTLKITLTYNEPRAKVTVTGGTGSGTYQWGDTYTIKATVPKGYRFVKWSDGNTNISRTFTVNSLLITDYETSKNYEAVFEKIPTYTVSTVASPTEGGTTTGDGVYYEGEEYTVSAVPNKGYKFIRWEYLVQGGHINDYDQSFKRVAEENTHYTAFFELDRINNVLVDTVQSLSVLIDTSEAFELYVDTTKVYG